MGKVGDIIRLFYINYCLSSNSLSLSFGRHSISVDVIGPCFVVAGCSFGLSQCCTHIGTYTKKYLTTQRKTHW